MNVKPSFSDEVKAFVQDHKTLCILTLGLAIVGFSIGKLAGRCVVWLRSCGGVAEKTNTVGRKVFKEKMVLPETKPLSSKIELKENPVVVSDLELQAKQPLQITAATEKLIRAFNSEEQGWVMIPPKDLMKVDESFVIGSGAVGFEGNGRWKIHVSIDPVQMEQALPIIIRVLHDKEAPRLGFKVQTKANLDSVHQIGKELAIIFDKEVEEAALKGDLKVVQNCLSELSKKLHSAGIRPEQGLVLTPETIDAITNAPEGTQIKEKQNLETGKFDREIPCSQGPQFFYYRDENFAPLRDDEIGDLKGEPGVFSTSDILKLARQEPHLAHNPTKSPDPFINLQL